MDKVMFLEVFNADELDDPPAFALVQFVDRLVKQIRKMVDVINSQPARDAGLYTVSIFDYTPDWYESFKDEDGWDVPESKFRYTEDFPGFGDGDDEKLVRMDAVTLCVSAVEGVNEFWWLGYIKHTPFQCTTYRLPVSILDEWETSNE